MTCDKEGNARVLFRIVWWLQNPTQKRPGPFLWIFTSAQRKTDSTFLRARVKQIRSFPRCIPAFRNSPLWENILYLNLHLSYSSRYPFIPLQFMTCAHRPLCETIVPMTTRIKYLCSLQPISPPRFCSNALIMNDLPQRPYFMVNHFQKSKLRIFMSSRVSTVIGVRSWCLSWLWFHYLCDLGQIAHMVGGTNTFHRSLLRKCREGRNRKCLAHCQVGWKSSINSSWYHFLAIKSID